MKKRIWLLVAIVSAKFAVGQSLGPGAMSFSGKIDGVYFNVSADFAVNFAMYSDEASTQLRFNWFKVNYVEYNGVRYDANSHPGGSANFGYLNSGYNARIKLTEYVPTKGYMDNTKTAYPSSWTDFRFSAGGEAWENLGMERRAAQKEKWRNRSSPGTISCLSVGGTEIQNIISAVKARANGGNSGQNNNTNAGTSGGWNTGSSTNSGNSNSRSSTSTARSSDTNNSNSGSSSGSGSNYGNTSNKNSGSSTQSREAERQRQLERKAQDYQRRQAEQEARRKAYEEFARNQNNQNQQMAAAGALAGIGVLAIFGKMIYGKMGYFDPSDAYHPGDVNVKGSFQFGYSQLVQPMWFNSVYTDGFGTRENLDYTYAWPTCFGMNIDLGIEHEYIGLEGYAGLRGGSSIFVTNYMLDVNYGFRAFAGLPNIKGYFEQGYGQRQLWMNDWVTFEQSGEGFSDVLWENFKYGVRISWGDYVRQHITAGIIQEAVGVNEGRIQIMENFNPDYDPNNRGIVNAGRPPLGEVFTSKFVEGYFLEWKKDHSFNFFLQVYPNYPFTGASIRNGTAEAAEENIDGGVLVNVGFVRSIDSFIGF